MMVPFWVPIILRHLLFRVPKKGTIILTTTHIYIYIYIHTHIHFVYGKAFIVKGFGVEGCEVIHTRSRVCRHVDIRQEACRISAPSSSPY